MRGQCLGVSGQSTEGPVSISEALRGPRDQNKADSGMGNESSEANQTLHGFCRHSSTGHWVGCKALPGGVEPGPRRRPAANGAHGDSAAGGWISAGPSLGTQQRETGKQRAPEQAPKPWHTRCSGQDPTGDGGSGSQGEAEAPLHRRLARGSTRGTASRGDEGEGHCETELES
ncbi:hypothetical protein NDU88_001877 [Pleurodeles waltl]|uniref:Uncharacterized protein n=1 Tax=Pleurodeles waltl TaxID=8319 RepID=A0AAV7Q8D8_PLEWA|nr:hypothetical protein NDU88_001877 [Pleurodeles waltl]